jgi:glycine/serine hydroxymethyltransferase
MFDIIEKEKKRQQESVDLIPSEVRWDKQKRGVFDKLLIII